MSEVPCHHVLSLKFRSSVVSPSLSPMTSRSLAHARRLLRLINFDVLTIEPQIHAVAHIGASLRGRRQSKRRAGTPLPPIVPGAVSQKVAIEHVTPAATTGLAAHPCGGPLHGAGRSEGTLR